MSFLSYFSSKIVVLYPSGANGIIKFGVCKDEYAIPPFCSKFNTKELKNMNKKVFSLFLAVVMFATMAAGCAPAATPAATQQPAATSAPGATEAPTTTGEAVTLEFQQWWEPEL